MVSQVAAEARGTLVRQLWGRSKGGVDSYRNSVPSAKEGVTRGGGGESFQQANDRLPHLLFTSALTRLRPGGQFSYDLPRARGDPLVIVGDPLIVAAVVGDVQVGDVHAKEEIDTDELWLMNKPFRLFCILIRVLIVVILWD
jgi:hypothetical protein